MIKIRAWYKEGGSYFTEELHNLRPRRYMAGWSFKKLLEYAKEELSWTSIDIDSITSFDIYSDKEHWCQNIIKRGMNGHHE